MANKIAAGEQHVLGVVDYVILVLVLLISCGIGVYYRFTGGRQKTANEYLMADKNMSIYPVAVSLMASFMSAITLLGLPSEIYVFGLHFVVINVAYGIFTPIVAYVYLPVFFKLQATSAYEYLEKRFGKVARLAASLSYTVQMILYMGIVLYAPALALEALTGILQFAAILSVGLVCTFYSTIGGMKAVLMTDVFQSLLMFAAIFSVIIYAAIDVGGLDQIWFIAEKGKRIDLLNFDPDPTVRHTWFSLIIGGGITFLTLYGVNQTQVQRYLTIKKLKDAQKAVWLTWPILSALSLSTCFAGLAIFSRYYDCDPVASGRITSDDQLIPFFVVDTMGDIPGLTGLFVAGIFSAALSTVSACVNSLAAVTMEDYFKPIYKKIKGQEVSESRFSIYTKIAALAYGLVCVGVAFMAQLLGGVLQASITIFGVIGGPLLGLFSLGMFTTTGNEKGATIGLLTGIAIAMWTAFGTPRPPAPRLPVSVEGCEQFSGGDLLSNLTYTGYGQSDDNSGEYFWLYRVSYMYNGVIGLFFSFVVGYVVSLIVKMVSKEKAKNLDPNLFIGIVGRRLKKKMEQNSKD